jgi:murein DD-endopeptidase MepM/ murein hydrolase activator NlpD
MMPSAVADTRPPGCIHEVRRGESIGRIAARYRTTTPALATANQLRDPNLVRAGRRLTIPGCATDLAVPADVPKASVSTARSAPERSASAAEVRTITPHRSGRAFVWPVHGSVTSRFGKRGLIGRHHGIDIGARPGAPIRAAAAGTVVFSGWQLGYGRVIEIAHRDGFATVYAHNQKNVVKVGDRVAAGTMIGTVGRTGRATSDHLHFEIRRRSVAQNPLALLATTQRVSESPVRVAADRSITSTRDVPVGPRAKLHRDRRTVSGG